MATVLQSTEIARGHCKSITNIRKSPFASEYSMVPPVITTHPKVAKINPSLRFNKEKH